jgi:hypothetical protein
LAGNLELLRRQYRAAVTDYDLALRLIPGMPEDAGDGIGRDAAWNRAIALRRIQDQEEDQPDGGPDASPDAADAGDDGGDSGPDEEDGGQDAGGEDGGEEGQPDAGEDGGGDQSDAPDGGRQDAGDRPDAAGSDQADREPPPPEQSGNQDQRMLDMLERAPTLQQQNAKDRALQRRGGGMEDK